MPRSEPDREDLLREATAMVERAELQVEFWPEPVFIGFRRDGSLSVYFGGDPVYQFNAAGDLRRALVEGLLYKADRRRLAQLRRERTASETLLVRCDLDEAHATTFLARKSDLLGRLLLAMQPCTGAQATLDARGLRVLGEVPVGSGVVLRAAAWLQQHAGSIAIAASPGVTRSAGE